MRRVAFAGVLVAATVLGLLIALVDTRPTWNDTGITVGVLALTCGLFGAAFPGRPWMWALASGGWIPVLNIALHGNYGSLLALVVAFIAAYVGAGARKVLTAISDPAAS